MAAPLPRPLLGLHWLFQAGVRALISEGFLVGPWALGLELTFFFFFFFFLKKGTGTLKKLINGKYFFPCFKNILFCKSKKKRNKNTTSVLYSLRLRVSGRRYSIGVRGVKQENGDES